MSDHTITLIALGLAAYAAIAITSSVGVLARRISRLERARAKPEDVTRMWDAVEWVEAVVKVERLFNGEVMVISEPHLCELEACVDNYKHQQALEASIMDEVRDTPQAQARDAHGRFVAKVAK